MDLIRLIGDPGENTSMEFPLEAHDTESAKAIIQSTIPGFRRIACLHPGASTQSKRWPIENYREIAVRLVKSGCGIILVGNPSEYPLCSQISNCFQNGSCLNACGRMDLMQTGALIDASHLFIGNDSGPMHIAIARKKPTIGLIGPYHPRFHKYKAHEATIFRNPVDNVGYDAIKIKESDYRWSIPVEAVFNEAMRMLG
jgi:heptosyltransferase-2